MIKLESKDGVTLYLPDRPEDMNPIYVRLIFNYDKIRRHFKMGIPVSKNVVIEYKGRRYTEGDSLDVAKKKETINDAALAIEAAKKDNAPQSPAKAPESAPTLDMFDNTDPNAPRTTGQNNAFWGLMEKLGKLTGKTGEEMKTVVVARALGENKGTSKLTIAEMEKVIGFLKDTIALFEAHNWATAGKEKEA